MKDTRIGKSDMGNEVVNFYLDDISDLRAIFEVIQGSIEGVGSFPFAEREDTFMRLEKDSEGNLYLISGIVGRYKSHRENLESVSLDELESKVNALRAAGREVTELLNGMPAIILDGLSSDELEEVCLRYMNRRSDFNLDLGEYCTVGWLPSLHEGKFLLQLAPTPATSVDDEYDFVTINGQKFFTV